MTMNSSISTPRYDIIAATQPAESYLAASPVSGAADIVAFRNSEGMIDVVSIGTTGKLHYLSRSYDSDTGWKADVIEAPTLKIKKYLSLAVARTADAGANSDRVFALVKSSNCSLVELVMRDDGRVLIEPRSQSFDWYFVQLQKVKYSNLEAGVAENGVILTIAVSGASGPKSHDYIVSWLEGAAPITRNYLARGTENSFFANLPIPVSTGSGPEMPVINHAIMDKSVRRPSVGLSLLGDFQNPSVSRAAGSCTSTLQSSFPVIESDQVAVLDTADGRSRLLGYAAGLCTLVSDAPVLTTSPTSWPAKWDMIDTTIPSDTGDDGHAMITRPSGALDGTGRTVIAGQGYAVVNGRTASKNTLWALSLKDGDTSEVLALATIGASVCAAPAMRCDAKGEVHVFQPTPMNQLLHFWLDSEGTWQSEDVSITTEDKAIKTSTYRTSLTVLDRDSNGPAAFLDVLADADEEIVVEVNGKTYVLGGGAEPECFTTSALGQLNVSQIITQLSEEETTPETSGSLAAPVLSFSLPGEPSQPAVLIRPEKHVNSALGKVTTSELQNALQPNGKHVFKDRDNLDQLKDGLRKGLDLMGDAFDLPPDVPFMYRRIKDLHGMRFVMPDENGHVTIPPDKIGASQPWMMEMRDGLPVFSDMTAEDAEAQIAAGRAQTDATVERLRAQGFLGLDWDGLWTDIRAGAAEVKKLAVSVAEATVTFAIDGIEQVMNFVLTTVKEVWSFITTILDYFGKFWGTVVGWILSIVGGLFGWDDILANKDDFKKQIKDFADDLPKRLPDLASTYGDPFKSWLAGAKSDIQAWGDTVKGTYGADQVKQANASKSDDGAPKSPADDLVGGDDGVWSKVTWLFDKVMSLFDELFGVPDPFGSGKLDQLARLVGDVITAVGSGLTNIVGGLIDSILSIVSSASDMGAETISSLVDLFTGFAGNTIDAVDGIVDPVLKIGQFLIDAATTLVGWLDKNLSIPFFTSFYKAAIGSDCTMLDIGCLLLSIPATLARKLAGVGATAVAVMSKKKTLDAVAAGMGVFVVAVLTALGDTLGAYEKKGFSALAFLATGIASGVILFGLVTADVDNSFLNVEFWFWVILLATTLAETVVAALVADKSLADATLAMEVIILSAATAQILWAMVQLVQAPGVKSVFAGAMLATGGIGTIMRLIIMREPASKSLVVEYAGAQAVATAATLGMHAGVCTTEDT